MSRRFGIQQGHKIRCIDDFSRSAVNSAVQTSESPKPHTVDVFAALCVYAMSQLQGDDWLGRTFDLVGAYRQCAIHPGSHKYAHIVVQKLGASQLFAFRMRALPFGAVKSVHAFLRVRYSLWYILVKEFMALTTNYFDDFVSMSTRCESQAVQSCVHMVLKMLGWIFAETGDKAPDFSEMFQALGVCVSVKSMGTGLVTIGSTDSRRQELIKTIEETLMSNKLTKADALKLRGRLQFASGNVFGRIAKSALAAVTTHAYHGTSTSREENTRLALTLHKHLLEQGRPRELHFKCCESWCVQTDACYEPQDDGIFAGIGAVPFAPDGRPTRFFSERCCSVLHRQQCGTRCFNFLHSSTDVAKGLLISVLALECIHQVTPWYAPVPTDSNMSDSPSRLDTKRLVALGAGHDSLTLEDCWMRHTALTKQWGKDRAAYPTQS